MILQRKEIRKNLTLHWTISIIFICVILIGQIPLSSISPILNPIVRGIENQVVVIKTRNYNEIETENFIVRYGEIEEKVLDLIIQTAEDKYRKAAEVFQYKPDNKVLLIIYDNPKEMMGTTMLRKGDPPMGVYYGDSVHILDPRLWVKEEQDLVNTFYYEGPVLHEIVHLFTDHVAGGNFPMWFTEGVSLYFEYMIDQYEWGKEVSFDEEDYTMEQLTKEFHQINTYRAYTKSFRIMRNFVQAQGIEALMEIMQSLGQGQPFSNFEHLFE